MSRARYCSSMVECPQCKLVAASDSFYAQTGNSKMKIERVGVMSPGDMGQAVAIQLKARGLNVCTALERRSERSRVLAREAGLTDVGALERLVAECDAVLSIMDPGAAVDFARAAAHALRATGRHTLIV